MNAATNRKLYGYSSLFITLALNMPKLLALRKDGVMAKFYHFDVYEFAFQSLTNFLFCLTLFYYNQGRKRTTPVIMVNILILAGFTMAGYLGQKAFFERGIFFAGGHGLRYTISIVLIFIELRISELLNANLRNELELLKGQLNPHFFFNAMSSLSGVVREDPAKAQHYINQLSKVFRYSLQRPEANLVTVREELAAVMSYGELLTMRFESGFELVVDVETAAFDRRLPHMALQLLVENAVKHNTASSARPLVVRIALADGSLTVSNNRQPVKHPEAGTGIGLSNLQERYKILMHRRIELRQEPDFFTVALPLQ